LVRIRESMWDAAEAHLAQAVAAGGGPLAARRDGLRADRFRSSSGASSDSRWPHLSACGWLLPLPRETERQLATQDRLEAPWDLGYRGLLPKALARSLAALPAEPAAALHPPTDRAERSLLRHLERLRPRALTKRVRPACVEAGGEGVDLFGAPLADSDEEASVRPAEASRAANIQAAALPIAHTIVAHMAWLRARLMALLTTRYPRGDWSREDAGRSDSSGSPPPYRPRHHLAALRRGRLLGSRARGPAAPPGPAWPRDGAVLLLPLGRAALSRESRLGAAPRDVASGPVDSPPLP